MSELREAFPQHAHHGRIAGQGCEIRGHGHLDGFGRLIACRVSFVPGFVVRAFVVPMDLTARLGVSRFHGQPAQRTDPNASQGVDQLRV